MLSYNNFFWQAALIISPMVVSVIYDFNKKCVFFFSAIFPLIAIAIMGYIATWDNVGEIGRKSMFEEEKKEKVDVEMQTVKETTKEGGLDDGKKEVKNEVTSLWCVCLQSAIKKRVVLWVE